MFGFSLNTCLGWRINQVDDGVPSGEATINVGGNSTVIRVKLMWSIEEMDGSEFQGRYKIL